MFTIQRPVNFCNLSCRLLVALIAVAMGLLTSNARAQNVFYESPANATQLYGSPDSWALGVVPEPTETAIFTNRSAYRVAFDFNPVTTGLTVINGSEPTFFPAGLISFPNRVYTITGRTLITDDGQLTLEGNGVRTIELRSNDTFRITPSVSSNRSGALRVLGGGRVTHTANDFLIGDGPSSTGRLDILDGGRVVDSGDSVRIARQSTSTGTVTVSGLNSVWQITAPIFNIGFAGDARLTISDGGSVSSVTARLGSEFNFIGDGTTQVTGLNSNWTNTGDLIIRNSGALNIDSDATVNIGGTLDLSTSSSSISLSGGTLTAGTIDRTGGAFNFTGGTLRTSNFIGDLTNAGGTFAPGISPALTTLSGSYTQQAAGTLEIELGGLLLGEFDQLAIAGDATLDGLLDVQLLSGFDLELDQQFTILDIAGTLVGEFIGLGEGDLVGNFGGQNLFISYTAGDGNDVALFTAVPEPSSLVLLSIGLLGLCRTRHQRRPNNPTNSVT